MQVDGRLRVPIQAGANRRQKDVKQMSEGCHHEPIIDEPPPLPSERSTGLVFAVVFLIAAILLRGTVALFLAALLASLAFLGLALLAPAVLAPLNRAWFALALVLNRFVSPIVMFVIYAVVIVPAGLLMQLLRDPLQSHRGDRRASYWIDRNGETPARSSMTDQF